MLFRQQIPILNYFRVGLGQCCIEVSSKEQPFFVKLCKKRVLNARGLFAEHKNCLKVRFELWKVN